MNGDRQRNDDTRHAAAARDERAGNEPTVGDQIGEAAGGMYGTLAGAAVGSLGGPVGTLIGGIAGAIGGWWAGRAVADSVQRLARDDATDAFYRGHYDSVETLADRSYEDVRPAYYVGHVAATNPDYAGRPFDEIEPELARGWASAAPRDASDWQSVRHFAREGYKRGGGGPARPRETRAEREGTGRDLGLDPRGAE